ncbi:urease cluster protein, partial [Streptococcus thermophilus]
PKQELSEEEKHAVQNHKWMILISIMITLILTGFAASQLSQVSGLACFRTTLATVLPYTCYST